MAISVFELFTIGIGPSSSHTVGPMRAAKRFVDRLREHHLLERVERVQVELYGSLGATGKGHGTDRAVLIGLEGETPEGVDPDHVGSRIAAIREHERLRLGGEREIGILEKRDMVFNRRQSLPLHSNGMRLRAFDAGDAPLFERTYYSIGGGFVVNAEEAQADQLTPDHTELPHRWTSGTEMLLEGERCGRKIWEMVLDNERCWRSDAEIRIGLMRIWHAMQGCVQRGCRERGTLPGGLRVPRRAPQMYEDLLARSPRSQWDPLSVLDWVNLYALAVNEENAAGGRVVTAPTNGAAGIVPAVLHYYRKHTPYASDDGVAQFLLTAGAIGILYKQNASISGAEVGCQGEVGVACSMAAAGLTAALGGNNAQVENAAEIGMEHNLGLTCDPIGGLVQIPCIERNAMGAVKAINASRIALSGDGRHEVSLDKVMAVMRQTGADMSTKYKETSRGGLAVTVIEC